MALQQRRLGRVARGLLLGALAAVVDCSVYDSSLLKGSAGTPSDVPPEEWGSGIGWWSKKLPDGCVTAGVPTPDDRPEATADGDVGDLWFAVRSMALGSLDRNGEATEGAWKELGFDLDGLCTNSPTCDIEEQTYACSSGASVPSDGNECRDNTFGQLEQQAISTPGLGTEFGLSNDAFNCALCRGDYNFLFRITGYNGETNDSNVRVDIYPSPGLETVPSAWKCELTAAPGSWKGNGCWLQTDRWTLQNGSFEGTLVSGADAPNALLNDPSAYVREGYIVAQLPENTNFWFPGQSAAVAFPLKLQRGIVVAKLVGADGAWSVQDGTIAGRARGSDLVASFESLGLCSQHPLYNFMKAQVGLTADVLWNGTNSEEATCDSISVGIGFEAAPAAVSDTPRDAVELPGCPPTPDAGTDSGSDSGQSDAG